jgi:hypothetical protein
VGCWKAALRPLILKISVSPETSSENGEVEIAGETLGSSKMSISPETSPKKRDVEIAAVRLLSGALLEDPQDGPRGEIIEKQWFCNTFVQK